VGQVDTARLQRHCEEVEAPGRSTLWPVQAVRQILRYGACVGSVIEHYEGLDRTMLQARQDIARIESSGCSVASGRTIIARRLTGSKGRFSRVWHAPEGGLWGSVIYVNTLLPASRMLLPLAVGVAGCEALRESGAGGANIRWINDVLIDGFKVAGFLAESFTGKVSGEEYCLIGFGINVNNDTFPDDLRGVASSLSRVLGRSIDLETFTCRFLAKLRWNIGLLHYWEDRLLSMDDGLPIDCRSPLVERWLQLSDSIGRRVSYGFDVMTSPQYEGRTTGLSPDGGLELVLDDGGRIIEHSGEIRYL